MADYSQCVHVPYPNPLEVKEEHRNWVVISNYFTVKPGTTDKNKEENRIMLKTFPMYIYSEDRKMFLDQKLSSVLHVMPLKNFDASQFDYDNTAEFQQINKEQDWLYTYPLAEQVLVYYTKVQSVGCEHYIRGCRFWCAKCQAYFGCRLCHDTVVEDHKFDRYAVERVECRYCQHEQPFQQICENCHKSFGWYICFQCKMICGLGQDAKPNYHCEGCNMCMVGRESSSKHCYQCGSCFNVDFFDRHKCAPVSGECTVCMEDIVNTIYGRYVPDCGHSMHSHCYSTLFNTGNYKCPICRRFLPKDDDKITVLRWMVGMYKQIFIPRVYSRVFVLCKCNDCQQEFPQHFTLYKHFCSDCENFNAEVVGDSTYSEYTTYAKTHNIWLPPMLPNEETCRTYILNKFGKNYKLNSVNAEQLNDEMLANAIAAEMDISFTSEQDQDIIVKLANDHTFQTLQEAVDLVKVIRNFGDVGAEMSDE